MGFRAVFGPSRLLVAGRNLDPLEIDFDRIGITFAVLLVVAWEGRHRDLDVKIVGAVTFWKLGILAVMVEPRVLKEFGFEADDFLAFLRQGAIDAEIGNETVIGRVRNGDLDVAVPLGAGLEPVELATLLVIHAFGAFLSKRHDVVARTGLCARIRNFSRHVV